jgi:predicted Zn-dependent protease
MKHWIILAAIVACGFAGILVSQRRKVDTPASPDAVLHFVGDTEHELTRLPMKLTRLSDTEEIQIGDELAKHYGRDWKPESKNDQDFIQAQTYLDRVGARVASSAHRKLPYRFHYIPWDSFVNAFALPGGHVFVSAGLLALMDSEDELAAVLGHEVEHVDLGHCAERVQIEARLRKLHLGVIGSLIEIPAIVFEAGYSKEQELAADREGTRLSVAANYSPNGAVRMFETFQRLEDEQRHPPKSPQQEFTQVAQTTIEDYFRTHPPSTERAQQIKDLIVSENWNGTRNETDLQIGYIYWMRQASRALGANRYDKAIGLSKRSLSVQADYMPALRVLAEAYFLSANFPEAAASYGQIVQRDLTPAFVRMYVDSLAAARPASGAQEYKQWLALHTDVSRRREYEVEMAGLEMLNGNNSPAQKILAELTAGGNDPEVRGRLGWWYYRAGAYDRAHELLEAAVEERPQIPELQTRLGWTLIERHQLETALSRFNHVNNRDCEPELRMGRAVAEWQAHSMDSALSNFAEATTQAPYWLNLRWVQATRSPLVVRSIAQLQAETERRHKVSREKKQQAAR